MKRFQRYLHGGKSVPLYSATRQQAERSLKRIGKSKEGKEYPMILRIDVYRADTKPTPHWLKISIYRVKGGINVPIKTHGPITDDMICRGQKSSGERADGLST